jgi:hypothetical protein
MKLASHSAFGASHQYQVTIYQEHKCRLIKRHNYLSAIPDGRACASAWLAASITQRQWACRRNEHEAGNRLTLLTFKNNAQAPAAMHAQKEPSRSMRRSLTISSLALVYNVGR